MLASKFYNVIKHKMKSEKSFVVFLLAPALLFMGFIMIYPLISSIYLSLYDYQITRPNDIEFAPIQNLMRLFKDDVFLTSILNTIYFTFITVVIGLFFGLLMALAIDQLSKKYSGIRGVILLPWVVPGIVVGYLFLYMFDLDVGIINFVLLKLKMIPEAKLWLMDTSLAMNAVIITHIWNQAPFYMLMITAGLKAIPIDIKEAVYCEGATRWQEFRYVTFPNIKGIMVISSLLMIIRNFNNFPIIFTMTGGGPVYSTTTTVLYIYRVAFEQFDMGYASLIGVIWVIVLSLVSAFYIKLLSKDF